MNIPLGEWQKHGFKSAPNFLRNAAAARLYEESLSRGEGRMTREGALLIETSPYTGRLPNDKFFVQEPSSQDFIGWGKVNKAFEHK